MRTAVSRCFDASLSILIEFEGKVWDCSEPSDDGFWFRVENKCLGCMQFLMRIATLQVGGNFYPTRPWCIDLFGGWPIMVGHGSTDVCTDVTNAGASARQSSATYRTFLLRREKMEPNQPTSRGLTCMMS